jgi:predicted nucleic acid-binding protein
LIAPRQERKWPPAVGRNQAARALSRLLTLLPAGARRIHDGNIVATCQAHGISSILTHNPGDFAPFTSVINIEPLVGVLSK